MAELEGALSKTTGKHTVALDWFHENKGDIIAWSDIQKFSSDHSRLVNQAKGIYKPGYSDYALSLRTIQNGPYPDKDVELDLPGFCGERLAHFSCPALECDGAQEAER
ncbi:hypothetical protein [Pseudooceanicola nitratireducens]|uniref:hypothetical protein n=1 Tax=Pseudooceanicola nitratireducens TaxID=517719 RepID=UPI0023F34591|nr:hypothetical protein [Pseudooceanicola nitratireducens]